MLVFAFDRDWTVDVNPHPRHEAVPLDWVRHLAHDTEHAVYAIGNQQLAEEAAIPGVVDIVGRHPDEWDEWLGGKQPNGRYVRFPSRRERLALIADLHPDATDYIVVDDIDLSDVPGWHHYHAWEFVPAVEQGGIDPSLPWATDTGTDDTVTDGGLLTLAGVMPSDPAHLRDFLEEHQDVPGYELTYTIDGDERTQLYWDVSVVTQSFERPAAKPVLECTPVTPTDETQTIPATSVTQLNIVRPPPDIILRDAESPAERARAFKRVAAIDADAVSVAELLTVIAAGNHDAEQDGVEALHRLAAERPADCAPALPVLTSLLERDDDNAWLPAFGTIRRVAAASPADVAPFVELLAAHLEGDNAAARFEALRAIAAVADADPADVVAVVPELASVVDQRASGYKYALHALACASREDIERVRPVSDVLSQCLTESDLADNARLNAIAALGRVVGEHPGEGVEVVDEVAALLDADNPKLRANAAGLVGDVGHVHTMAIRPYVDELVALLTDDDTYTRINASAAVARVAEDYPDAVAPHVDCLAELLTDDHEIVRENACWALGYLGPRADAVLDRLDACGTDDENADVRTRAQWAIDQIDT